MSWFAWRAGELQLELQIQPGAKRDAFAGLHGDRLKIKVHAPPLDGRANEQLVAFLAASFDTAKSNIGIVRGESGRAKSVRIRGARKLPKELLALGLSFAN